jgi:hypothetical protein
MKYTLTQEGVRIWNKHSDIKIYPDTTFTIQETGSDEIVVIDMCDVESPKMSMKRDMLFHFVETPKQEKQKKALLVDDNGGMYLNKETQEQINNIEFMLEQLLQKKCGDML